MKAPMILFLVASACGAWAQNPPSLQPAPIYSDGMVLQRDTGTPIFGNSTPNAVVTVRLDDAAPVETTSDADGRWSVSLPPQPAGGPHDVIVSSGDEERRFRDVYFGEVWLAGGQSNMQWFLAGAEGGPEAMKEPDPLLRFVTVPRRAHPEAPNEQPQIAEGWQKFDEPQNRFLSAVAYWFAKDLRRTLDVPVGIILANHGGTPIEAWMSRAALNANPTAAESLSEWDRIIASKPLAAHRRIYDDFLKQNPRPKQIPRGPFHKSRPAGLYETMIQPTAPYAVRGFLFYQGEANASRADQYTAMMEAMVGDWRGLWGNPDLPFYFVQLSAWGDKRAGGRWPALRAAQAEAARRIPHSGMAVSIDHGEKDNIHPPRKQPIGERLARLALARTHGLPIDDRGPAALELISSSGDTLRIRFEDVDGGLAIAGGGDTVHGFALETHDGTRTAVPASLDGKDTVRIDLPADADPPVAITYGWADYPEPPVNLSDSEGLPAEPFRLPVNR